MRWALLIVPLLFLKNLCITSSHALSEYILYFYNSYAYIIINQHVEAILFIFNYKL